MGMFDPGGSLGGMAPWLKLALQSAAGGFAGTAAAQRAGAQSFGAGLGPGVAGGSAYGLEMQQAERRNQYMEQQQKYMEAQAERQRQQQAAEAAQQKQIDAYIATLPPEQQQMARMAPKEVIGAQLKGMFPEPLRPTSDIQNYEYGKQNPDFLAQQEKLRRAGGTNVTVGGSTITNNPPIPMTTGTATALQTKEFAESDQLARLNQIEKGFDPKWLQLGPRAGQALSAMQELVGIPLSKEAEADLYKYTQFRRDTVENYNQTLRDLTGAALSPGEATRMVAQVPVAGTGVFDGDSPTQFRAKMDGLNKSIRLALMRRHWALKKNVDPMQTGVDLADVPNLVRRTRDETRAGLKASMPGLTEQQLEMEVRKRLADLFGDY